MPRDTLPAIALGVLVAAAIVAGLLTVGGPGQGRIERRDSERLSDLHRLESYVACVAALGDGTLPESLDPDERCAGSDYLVDPFTSEPYRYEKLSETGYRICARFEQVGNVPGHVNPQFDRETGCMTYVHRPSNRRPAVAD